MKTSAFALAVSLAFSGCIYLTSPSTPPPVETPDANGITHYAFDWKTAAFYLTQIVACVRWALIEYKHYKLLKAGKKDENRDGKED